MRKHKQYPGGWFKFICPSVRDLLSRKKMSEEAAKLFIGFDFRKQEEVLYQLDLMELNPKLQRDVKKAFDALRYFDPDYHVERGKMIRNERLVKSTIPMHLRLQFIERKTR